MVHQSLPGEGLNQRTAASIAIFAPFESERPHLDNVGPHNDGPRFVVSAIATSGTDSEGVEMSHRRARDGEPWCKRRSWSGKAAARAGLRQIRRWLESRAHQKRKGRMTSMTPWLRGALGDPKRKRIYTCTRLPLCDIFSTPNALLISIMPSGTGVVDAFKSKCPARCSPSSARRCPQCTR